MKQRLISKLKNKQYRDAFVASQINVGLPFQVRALRVNRSLSQGGLAQKAGMKQPRISAIERPGSGKLNLETLRRLASAFDVGLLVRFVPFSELVKLSEEFGPDEFSVLSFDQDIGLFREASVASTDVNYLPSGAVTQVMMEVQFLNCVTAHFAPVTSTPHKTSYTYLTKPPLNLDSLRFIRTRFVSPRRKRSPLPYAGNFVQVDQTDLSLPKAA